MDPKEDTVNSIISSVSEAAVAQANSSQSQLVHSPTENLGNESVEKVVKIELYESAGSFSGTENVQREEINVEAQEIIKDNQDGVQVIAKKDFVRSESCLADLEPEKPKSAKAKIPNRRQLETKSNVLKQPSNLASENSRSSMMSSTSKVSENSTKHAMELPHPLGKVPKYLNRIKTTEGRSTRLMSSNTKSRLISSSPSETPSTIASKTQTLDIHLKLTESKRRATELEKKVQLLQTKLAESEKLISETNKKLQKEVEKSSNYHNQLLSRKREVKKTEDSNQEIVDLVKTQKKEIENLSTARDDLTKKISTKEGLIEKLNSKVNRLERENAKKTQITETLEFELNQLKQQLESKDVPKETEKRKMEKRIQDLEKLLKSRELEITSWKNKAEDLSSENNILQTKSQELDKFDCGDNSQLMRDSLTLKSLTKQHKQEIEILNSKLADEKSTNLRIENILSLRGDYIKTLLEADENNKCQIILQIREIETLREKEAKAKKFKCSTKEELNNLVNTLRSNEMEIKRKDEKIMKYKAKIKELEAHEH